MTEAVTADVDINSEKKIEEIQQDGADGGDSTNDGKNDEKYAASTSSLEDAMKKCIKQSNRTREELEEAALVSIMI